MSKFRDFFDEYRVLVYGYISWVILHVILLFCHVGYSDYGLWPFTPSEYGFLEFFVYVIAIPVVVFILIDIHNNGWANRR